MADLPRRAAASSSRLSPEEITNRGFASAFRGISETEVRNFLRRVADEIVAMRAHEAELQGEIEALQEQIRNPTPVTEQELLSSLGEETARVLRSAQEAAEEIRKRAEERAGALVREAQEASARMREEAQQRAAARTEAAAKQASEVEQEAEARATLLREESEREAEALRELTATETGEVRQTTEALAAEVLATARSDGRALVDEARTVRERVLADLGRRRSLLQAQVDELRSGRDRLLDAYRVVKRTLSDATDALGQVEARANAELAAPPARVSVPPVEGELEVLEGEPDGAAEREGEPDGVVEPPAADAPEPDGPDEPEQGRTPDAEDSGAAVDALFARLRSHTVDPGPGATLPAPAPTVEPAAEEASEPASEGAAEPASEEPAPTEAPTAPTASGGPVTTEPAVAPSGAKAPEEEDAAEPEPISGDDVLRAERAAVLDPLARDLGRRAKRALQDQQNELLDRIRTIKGKVDATEVLPDVDAQVAAWVPVLDAPLSSAYAGAHAAFAAGEDAPEPQPSRELLEEIARAMVEPWRQRLVSAIDGAGDDPDAVTQRLGARYREYRGRELEDALGDALAAVWASGTFAAVPDGTLLRWIPVEVGRCPDCDDNSLEPTARNAPFPTGQLLPPAHPGCRCFLAPAEPGPTTTKKK